MFPQAFRLYPTALSLDERRRRAWVDEAISQLFSAARDRTCVLEQLLRVEVSGSLGSAAEHDEPFFRNCTRAGFSHSSQSRSSSKRSPSSVTDSISKCRVSQTNTALNRQDLRRASPSSGSRLSASSATKSCTTLTARMTIANPRYQQGGDRSHCD